MSYIDDIFKRANIQNIREFLLHDVSSFDVSSKTYVARIDEARNKALEMIKLKYPEMDEYELITAEIYNYVSTVQDVYMEIGLQCGATLVKQLFNL